MYSLFHLIRIIAVLTFSGVFFTDKKRGKRLTKALKILGPSFIKLGQTLSVRPDLVGHEVAEALSDLQDNVPPFSSKKARKIIEKELGKTLEQLFSKFEKNAVAAASIAQVHKAVTLDGEKVAVKILRPNIERDFGKDIKLFYSIAHILKRFKKVKRLRPVAVVDVFANSVKKELDLRLEAASASELKENCAGDAEIYIPKIYWPLISRRILVTEWIDGAPIYDRDALIAAGHDLEILTERLSISFLNQSFRDGFFHADIHPGNIFVDSEGRIVPIDFGIMGRLDKQTRIYVAEILRGFLTGDYKHVARVHFDAGYVPAHKSEADFMLACRAIGEPIMGLPVSQVSIAKLLAMLFKVTEDFDMETQPQLLLLQKTMVLVEGVGQKLYPQVNMWQQAEGWIENWAKSNLGIEARLKDEAKQIFSMFIDLPKQLKKIDKVLNKVLED
ncbi:MAG: engA [Rickettsiaceae bacterium]|jgi:ubiquinone biosynthesis protein|nr:engA [Rickettsiaceae bacterium]